MPNIWVKVGMNLEISDEEVTEIFEDNRLDLVIMRALRESRATPEGESRVPSIIVQDFNQENGTNYKCEDIETVL